MIRSFGLLLKLTDSRTGVYRKDGAWQEAKECRKKEDTKQRGDAPIELRGGDVYIYNICLHIELP